MFSFQTLFGFFFLRRRTGHREGAARIFFLEDNVINELLIITPFVIHTFGGSSKNFKGSVVVSPFSLDIVQTFFLFDEFDLYSTFINDGGAFLPLSFGVGVYVMDVETAMVFTIERQCGDIFVGTEIAQVFKTLFGYCVGVFITPISTNVVTTLFNVVGQGSF